MTKKIRRVPICRPEKFIYLTQKQMDALRKQQYVIQDCCCAVLGLSIPFRECVFDHRHRKKGEPLGGVEGLGLLRGVISKKVNTFEGKVKRWYIRAGLKDQIPLPELLRRLADYIETPPIEQIYVHPNEKPKPKKLSKLDYNRVCKFWFLMNPRKRTLPKYPKSGKSSSLWEEWIFSAGEWNRLLQQNKLNFEQKDLIKKAMEMIK